MPSPISPTACASRPSKGGAQTATLRRVEGAQAAGTGDGGQAIVEGAPVSTGREAQVTEAGRLPLLRGLAQRSLSSSTWRAP